MSQNEIVATRTRVGGLQAPTSLDTTPPDACRKLGIGDHKMREPLGVFTTGEDR